MLRGLCIGGIYGLRYEDVLRIRETMSAVTRTVPVKHIRKKGRLGERSLELRIVGNRERLVSEIRFARETFSGPRSGHLPDVIITWTNKKLATRVSSKPLGEIYAESRSGRGGNHRPDGFCILLKQGRRRWDEFKATNIGDLRVMILQRFGVYSGGSLECF